MPKKILLFVFIIPLLFGVSCSSSKTGAPGENKSIQVNYGSVVLKIKGHMENPDSTETETRNETKTLSKGKKYNFSVLYGEVISITVLSANNKDAEITVHGYGNERKFPVKGNDKTGVFLAFQNK
ncbi:MAG: hypothetical protein LBH16_12545 [Treponema sp.]|nr:hypothetical protein [Treponema sp.]